MKTFPSRESARSIARTAARLQLRKTAVFTTLFAVVLSTFTFVNQSPVRAATVGSGSCVQTVDSNAGVSVTQTGFDCVVTFTAGTVNWTVPSGVTSVRTLIVGGGGGGGAWVGAGGGGGGFRDLSSVSVAANATVAVTVGAGGTPANVSGGGYLNVGGNGGDSSFGSYVSKGGGKGGSHDPDNGTNVATLKPYEGGSGGGGTGRGGIANAEYVTLSTGATGNTPTTTPSQGNSGGNGYVGGTWVAGGGGGAGGVGSDGTSTTGGAGGAGLTSNISGNAVLYAGGGGGVSYATANFGNGGSGGGGNGGRTDVNSGTGVSGTANTGGGGGGGTASVNTSTGGSGGSGVVIVRYAVTTTAGTGPCQQSVGSASGITATQVGNDCVVTFTAGSNAWTAPSTVSTVRTMVIGGGGAGGCGIGGGGGAGEYVEYASFGVTAGASYTLNVGSGGLAQACGAGLPGANSTFSTITAYGGGGGGVNEAIGPTRALGSGVEANGSGGGGGYPNITYTGATTSSANPKELFTTTRRTISGATVSAYGGGIGSNGGGPAATAGGGGGAGGAGVAGSSVNVSNQYGGNGGLGISSNITGVSAFYAGGGGGGINGNPGNTCDCTSTGLPGSGGSGVGGSAGAKTATNPYPGSPNTIGNGLEGVANTGSGGGGGSNTSGGSGAAGVVIIRYTMATQSAVTLSSTNGYLGSSLALTASGGSGSGAVTYAVTTAGTANCSVSGSTLSFTSIGSCTVTATKAGADGYASASSTATTVNVVSGLIAYESFDGTSMPVITAGGTGSTGLSGSWLGVNSQNYLAAGSLTPEFANNSIMNSEMGRSFPAGVGFTLPSSNSGITLASNGGGPHYRQFARALSSSISMDANGTYYMSFLGSGGGEDMQLMAGLLTGLPTSISDTAQKSLLMGIAPSAGTNSQYAIDYGTANRFAGCPDDGVTACTATTVYSAASAISGGVLARSTVNGKSYGHFVLAKITAQASGNDTVQVKYFTQTSSIPTDDSAISWDTTYSSAITGSFTHLTTQMVGSGYAYMDEFRLGRNYASVVNPKTTSVVTLNPNYSGSTVTTQTISSGVDTVVAPATRTGYVFTGWNTNQDGVSGTDYTATQAINITTDTTLYAKWREYTITLAAGSYGTGASQVFTKSYNVNYTMPDFATASGYFTRSGYKIIGWTTSSNGVTVSSAFGAAITSNADQIFYPVWEGLQRNDYSLNFTGYSGSYAIVTAGVIPTVANTTFTVEAWVKPSSNTVDNWNAVIFSQGTTSANRFYLKRDQLGNLRMMRPGAPAEILCGNIPANYWNHVAVTFTANAATSCYLNGQLQNSTTGTTAITTKFVVGGFSDDLVTQNYSWIGQIDEVRVLNVARTAAQILIDAHTYGPVTDTSLIAYYDFNDGTGSTASNKKTGAAANTNLTLNGSPAWTDIAATTSTSGVSRVTFERTYLNNYGGWLPPDGFSNFRALIVGGGGGGGDSASNLTGGGGGAGGYFATDTLSATGKLAITVGAGGAGGPSTSAQGAAGGTSSIGTLKVGGGGGGNGYQYATVASAGAGVGGADFLSSGNGGGGRSKSFGDNAAKTGGAGGTIASAGVTFQSNTYTGTTGVAGNDAYVGDTQSGGYGGARTASTRTSDISGASVVYAKPGPYRAWEDGSNTDRPFTYGSGGATNYTYGITEAASNFGGTGAPGVVILAWEAEKVVTFKSNYTGGPADTTQSVVPSVSTALTANAFTRTGHTFAGWTQNADGTGTSYTDGQNVSTSTNLDLYAKWTPNTYAVTYNSNGGSAVADGSFAYGGSITSAPTAPNLSGFAFAGWSATNGGAAVTFPYTPGGTSAITLYAKWVGVPFLNYNASDLNSFDSGGTSVTDLSASGINGTTQNNLSYSDTSYAWSFAGGTRTAAPYVDVANMSSNNFSNGFTVDFEANFGSQTNSYERIFDFSESGNSNDNIFIARGDTTNNLQLRIYNGSTVNTCTFLGAITENTMTRYTVVKNSTSCILYTNNLTWTIAATWMEAPNLTLTDNFIGRSNWNDPSFEGQIRSVRMYSQPLTLSQVGALTYRTVTFDTNGGTATGVTSATTSGKLKLASTPTKAGFSFTGWWDASSGGTLVGSNLAEFTPTDSTTVYAQWSADTYTITYDSNGGSSHSNGTFTGGGSGLTLPTATKTGYQFAGWFEDSALTGSAVTTPYSPTRTRTLYAKWTANSQTISYAGGTGATGSAPTSPVSVDYGSTFTTPANTYTKPGYTFAGWSNGSATYLANETYPSAGSITGNVSLTATWTADQNTVLFKSNFTDGPADASQLITTDAATNLTSNPFTQAGYKFVGWTTAADGTGTSYTNRQSVTLQGALTLYAKWSSASTLGSGVCAQTVEGLTGATTTQGSSCLVAIKSGSAGTWHVPSGVTSIDYLVVGGGGGGGNYGGGGAGGFYQTTNVTVTPGSSISSITVGDGGAGSTNTSDSTRVGSNGSSSSFMTTTVGGGGGGGGQSATAALTTPTVPAAGGSGGGAGGRNSSGAAAGSGSTNVNAGGSSVVLQSNQAFAGAGGGGAGAAGASVTSANLAPPVLIGGAGGIGLVSSLLNEASAAAGVLNIGEANPSGSLDQVLFAGGGGGGSNNVSVAGTTATGGAGGLGGGALGKTATAAKANSGGGGAGRGSTGFVGQVSSAGGSGVILIRFAIPGVTGLSAAPKSLSTTEVDLSWTEPASGSGVIGYVIEKSAAGANTWSAATTTPDLSSTTGSSVVVSGLTSDTDYDFRVTAKYATGNGARVTNSATTTATSQTITFKSNYTGGPSDSTQTVSSFTSTALTANAFTRAGWAFDGWATAADGTGTSYTDGQSVTLTAGLTLYAKWAVNTNTVTYDSKGGSAVNSGSFVTGGSIASAPTAPNRTGYVFDGWSATDGGAAIAFPYSPSATTAITLYARWIEITYTVTYDVNGATGSAERSTQVYTYTGGALTLARVASMVKTGYNFDGWAETNGGTKISGTYTPTSDKTLYARWVAESYTITYYYATATAGAPTATAGSYTTGGSAHSVTTAGTLVRTGYTFAGWNTKPDMTGTNYAAGANLTTSTNVDLYAKWTANSYSVTYSSLNTDGGTVPTDATVYNIGNSVVVKANSGSLTRTGYTFAGWTTNSSDTIYNVGDTVYNSGDTYTVGSASITFYPMWTANTYNISYNANGATGDPARASDTYTTGGSTISLPNVGTMIKTGYTFAGWSTTSTGSVHSGAFTTTSDVTLYAIWTIKSIPYKLLMGSANSNPLSGSHIPVFPLTDTITSTYGASVVLPSVGTGDEDIAASATYSGSSYKFLGWKYGSRIYAPGASFTIPDLVSPATQLEFTAQWIRILEVRYVLNGGTGIVDVDADDCHPSTFLCLDGDVIGLSAAPSRSGYTFAGWTVAADGTGTVFQPAATYTVTPSNYVFYAKWNAVDYSMSFDSNGGNTTTAAMTKNIGQSFTFPSPGTRTGYDFNGWVNGSIQNSPTYGAGTPYVVGNASIPFVASWTPHRYTVSYNWNGGVGSVESDVVYTVGTTAITLPGVGDHVRDGYVFDGWAETDGGVKLAATYSPTSNKLLFARWIDGAYTITFNTVGGTLAQGTASVNRGASYTLPTPTRAGFVFSGWYEDSANTLVYGSAGASKTPLASKQIYAKWIQNSLAGIEPAHLNSLATLTSTTGSSGSWSGTHVRSGTGASINIPDGALPHGTVVQVSFVEDLTRPAGLIDGNNAYFTSVVVHWLHGTGSTATVPTASTPITMTLTNPAIVAGAKVFKIVNGVVTEVATAMVDGSVQISFTEDPEFVVAATRPGTPTSVSATNAENTTSTVTWTAPGGNGGSAITSYTVTAAPGGATCTSITTTCTFTGLTNNTSYTFTVAARNAIGTSAISSASTAIIPRATPIYNLTFNSNGGSAVSATTFLQGSSISAPTDPTRSGYTFAGWATTNGGSAITFPYSPSNADLTLFAIWQANPVAVTTPTPKATKSATPKATSSAKPSASATEEPTIEPSAEPSAEPTKPAESATPVEPVETSDSSGVAGGALALLALIAAAIFGYSIRKRLRKP